MTRSILAPILALALAAPASAREAGPILDYRAAATRDAPAASSAADRDRVARALAEDAPPALRRELGAAFVVLGSAPGAFTAAGARERVHLVQETAPVAIDPFPKGAAPVLVAIGPAGPARFFRLPTDAQYRRLAAARDLDGDGRAEVLLEASVMNMGELATGLAVLRLDPAAGTALPVQTVANVATDSCDGRRGKRTGAVVTADGAGRLAARPYPLACR